MNELTPESKTRLITIAEVGALIAVLVIGLLIGWYLSRRATPVDTTTPTGTSQTNPDGTQTSNTLAPVDDNFRVPEQGEEVSGDLAAPQSVVEAAPGVEAKARSFAVSVNNNAFTPSTIAARVGDTISIRFTAQDKDYDFAQPDMGLSAKLLKGKEQLIQVSPTATGKFTFFCASCGGPDKGPVGYIVVAPKQ